MSDYDREVEAIRAYNQPILDAFQAWLEVSGLSKRTVKNHIENINARLRCVLYEDKDDSWKH